MKSIRLTPCAAAVAAAVLQMTSPVQAATCTLISNGLWQTPGDWSCNQEPGAGDLLSREGLLTVLSAAPGRRADPFTGIYRFSWG